MNRPNVVTLFRLLDTRRRIDAFMWAARSRVIRDQLVQMRQTAP